MSTATDIITTVAAALGGTSALGLAAAKVWTWWTTRDAAKLAAETKRAEAHDARESTATDRLVAAYEAQATQAEARATQAAEGRAAVAQAIVESAGATRDLANEVSELSDAIRLHDAREAEVTARHDATHAALSAKLDEVLAYVRGAATGEHRAARGQS